MSWPPPGNLPIGTDPSWPRAIYPFGAPESVSTERPLLVLTEFGLHYNDLVFTVRNLDATHRVVFYVDHAQSGVVSNAVRDIIGVDPGHEADLVFRDILSLFWGMSAAGDPDGGFPACNITWSLVGRRRNYS